MAACDASQYLLVVMAVLRGTPGVGVVQPLELFHPYSVRNAVDADERPGRQS